MKPRQRLVKLDLKSDFPLPKTDINDRELDKLISDKKIENNFWRFAIKSINLFGKNQVDWVKKSRE